MTREVNIESFSGTRHVVIADGVKGAVIASNEILVTWDRRVVAAALRSSSGDGDSELTSGKSKAAVGLSEEENRSHSVRDVPRVVASDGNVDLFDVIWNGDMQPSLQTSGLKEYCFESLLVVWPWKTALRVQSEPQK